MGVGPTHLLSIQTTSNRTFEVLKSLVLHGVGVAQPASNRTFEVLK